MKSHKGGLKSLENTPGQAIKFSCLEIMQNTQLVHVQNEPKLWPHGDLWTKV